MDNKKEIISCPVINKGRSCEFADEAADKALKKFFFMIGIDINDPHDIEKFRRGLRFSEDMRTMANRGLLAVLLSIVASLMAAFFAGLRISLK